MATRPSSKEARRRRAHRANVERGSYWDRLRATFPEDFVGGRLRHQIHPQMVPEIEARIAMYREDAAARRPIRYIARTVRLAAQAVRDRS